MFSELWNAIKEIFTQAPAVAPKLPTPAPAPKYANRKAFLDALAWSEGTSQIPNSDNGYRALEGGGTFTSYATHPNVKVWIKRIGAYSDAAGRYCLMARYWPPYSRLLGLKDFSPPSQDAIATQQLKECGALAYIDAGNFSAAVKKAATIWASLPGSPYGQSIRTFDQVKAVYVASGGMFAASVDNA